MPDSKVLRLEVDVKILIAFCFLVFFIGLYLIPISQLMWFSDSVDSVLKWFSGDFLPRFTEFTSSTIVTLASPSCLALYLTCSFIYSCWLNWPEVKLSAHNVWLPLERAIAALFQLISSPQVLLQYALFAIIVNIFPEVVRQVSQGLLKANRFQ